MIFNVKALAIPIQIVQRLALVDPEWRCKQPWLGRGSQEKVNIYIHELQGF